MKKIIINILLVVLLVSIIPLESYSNTGVKIIRETRIVKWPRHRPYCIVIVRHHRRHRIIWLPPPWLPYPMPIPRDPVK